MKKVILFFALIAFSFSGNAQFIKNPTVDLLKDDSSIKQLLANLIEGWEVKTDSTAMCFYRKEKAWIPRENLKSLLACETCKATLPPSRVINFNMDKRMCFEVPVYFKLYVSTLSDANEVEKIKANNIAKSAEIEKVKSKHKHGELETKYNLDMLSNFSASMTKSEVKARTKYLTDLKNAGFVLPPTHLGEKYALHLVYVQGDIDSEKTDPPGINNEVKAIRTLLSGYCEEVK
ncbi:MAG: hypothetical protein V4667_00285 [Bacteroidota bacterium]